MNKLTLSLFVVSFVLALPLPATTTEPEGSRTAAESAKDDSAGNEPSPAPQEEPLSPDTDTDTDTDTDKDKSDPPTQEVAKKKGDSVDEADIDRSRDHFRRGTSLIAEGDLEGGIRALEEAHKLYPHRALAYTLGRAYLDIGDEEASLRYFRLYLESGGEDIPLVRDLVTRLEARLEYGKPCELEMRPPPLVFSASLRPQRIGASPSAITVLTRSTIVAAGVTSLHDVLRLVPGVDVFSFSRSWAVLGARTATTDGSNLLVVLIDGRELAFEGVGVPYTSGLPVSLEEIEQIEVIRGPGSAIYGPNAFQAVVNIITRKPSNLTEHGHRGGLSIWSGTYGTGYAQGWAAAPVGNWHILASTGHEFSEPFADSSLPHRVFRGRVRAENALSESLNLALEAGASQMQGSGYAALGAWHFERNLAPYASMQLSAGPLDIQAWVNHFVWELHSDPGIAIYNEGGADIVLGHFRTPEGTDTLDTIATTADLFARRSFTGLLPGNIRHQSMLGVGLRKTSTEAGIFVDCPEPFTSLDDCQQPRNLEEWRASAFAHADLFPADFFTLTLGTRVDWNSILQEAISLSPRVAGVWHLSENNDIRLGYGRAYRKPSQLELFGRLAIELNETGEMLANLDSRVAAIPELFATRIGNPELNTEKIDAYEIGWRGRFFRGRMDASLDLWVYRLFDFTRWVRNNEEGGVEFRFHTLEEPSIVYGGEFSLDGSPNPWLRLGSSFGYRQSVDDPDGTIMNKPQVSDYYMPQFTIDSRLGVGYDLGPRFWLSTNWRSRYYAHIRHPVSSLEPSVRGHLGGRLRVTSAISWRMRLGDALVEFGASGQDITSGIAGLGGARKGELTGCPMVLDCPDDVDGAYGAEPQERVWLGFIRAEF